MIIFAFREYLCTMRLRKIFLFRLFALTLIATFCCKSWRTSVLYNIKTELDWSAIQNYILDNEACQNFTNLNAIFLVTSYAGHRALRQAHREAISQEDLEKMKFQRIFILAKIPPREKSINQFDILEEYEKYGDLLQGDFLESYFNLSYKHIMGLQWAVTNCQHAKFIIKMDDDVVFDVFYLRKFLIDFYTKNFNLSNSDALMAGKVFYNPRPYRYYWSKWYVSKDIYTYNNYPTFTPGLLYITNRATAMRLVNEAYKQPIYWIDDVFVTGILRTSLNIPIKRINELYTGSSFIMRCCIQRLKENNWTCPYYIAPNDGDDRMITDFMHAVKKCYNQDEKWEICRKPTESEILTAPCSKTLGKYLSDIFTIDW